MSAFLIIISLSSLNRGHSEFFTEGPAKIAHIVETAFFCHLADGQMGLLQIALGGIDSGQQQIAHNGNTGNVFENMGQVRDTHIALRCNEIQGDGV